MDLSFEAQGLAGPRGTDRIQDVSFTLEPGALLHVRGPSGSGKTSLLRLMAGLDPRSGGDLRLDGQGIDEVPITVWRRRVALVFQEPRLFPGTIEENITWAARHHGLTVDAGDLRDAVGLSLPLDRDVRGLSGGEAKRVQLARSLAVAPDVLLLDEPTSSLDAANRGKVHELIGRLKERELGLVVVSHLEEDHADLFGDVMRLDGGRPVGPVAPAHPEAR